MYVLGISCGHDGSVALVKDGKLKAFIATERLNRVKKSRGVTKAGIKYVLDKEGIKLKDVSIAAVVNWFWDRGSDNIELWDKTEDDFSIIKEPRSEEYLYDDFVAFHNDPNIVAQGPYTLKIGNQSMPCLHVDHHFAHCSSAYYLSSFDRALCVSVDFSDGMGANHSAYYFDDKMHMFRNLRKGGDFAVGSFYGQICDYLGFYPSLTDAGKVMALAAYGKVNKKVVDGLSWPDVVQMGDIFHGDQYRHLLLRSGVSNMPNRTAFFPQLEGEGGIADPAWRDPEKWKSKETKDMAANAQHILETSIHNLIDKFHTEMSSVTENLCLAGGTMLNVVSNGKLLNTFENIFIPPAPGDDGTSIGAAMFLWDQIEKDSKGALNTRTEPPKRHIHTVNEVFEGGKTYSVSDIKDAIIDAENEGYEVSKYTKKLLYKAVAKFLSEGKIVAWFQNGSEIGPRALGHRSILADPRDKNMKDKLNKLVKHREEFRPFAPVILDEHVNDWFDLDRSSPYMLFSVDALKSGEIPSAVHVDGSARVQTVAEPHVLHRLLTAWYDLTDVPILINTSFNVKGEPIVESPEDAVACFLGTEIDVLVMHDYVIVK